MTDLTEQWKKGELEWYKSYYCQNRKGEVTKAICLGDSELHSEELGGTLDIGYWKVLAPVPSYEEWKEKQKSLKVLAEEYCKEKKEYQQLKELLKEYKKQLSEIKNAYIDLTTQDEYGSYYIDEAKLFVETVGKTIKDYDELELKQDEVLK